MKKNKIKLNLKKSYKTTPKKHQKSKNVKYVQKLKNFKKSKKNIYFFFTKISLFPNIRNMPLHQSCTARS